MAVNNGAFYSQTQGLKLSTNSTNRVIVSTAGTTTFTGITSGSTLIDVRGTSGQLMSVTDTLTGSLLTVNNNIGGSIFQVNSNNSVIGGTPNTNTFVISGTNIGIGILTPTNKLHISDTTNPIRVEGLQLSGSSSNNRFLVTDSNGVVTYRTDVLTGSSSISAVTLSSSNILSVTSNGGSATTTTINAVTGGSYLNGTLIFSGSGNVNGVQITGFSTNTSTSFTGGTVSGATVFISGLTANTLNVTGRTRLDGVTADTLTVTGNTITSGLTATIISATTYQNLPNTLYTGNGVLSGNRVVNLSSYTLNFSSTTNPNTLIMSGGNVGIGTATLESKLQVSGLTTITGQWNTGSTVNGLHFSFGHPTFGANIGQIYSLQNGSAWRRLDVEGSPLVLNAQSGGNVGIGTVSPSNKLHVFAATDPIKVEGVQTSTDTELLTIDGSGVVHKVSVSSVGAFLRNETNSGATDTININQSIFNPSNLTVLSTSIFIVDTNADYYVLGDLYNDGEIVVNGTLKVGGNIYNSGTITGSGIIE